MNKCEKFISVSVFVMNQLLSCMLVRVTERLNENVSFSTVDIAYVLFPGFPPTPLSSPVLAHLCCSLAHHSGFHGQVHARRIQWLASECLDKGVMLYWDLSKLRLKPLCPTSNAMYPEARRSFFLKLVRNDLHIVRHSKLLVNPLSILTLCINGPYVNEGVLL